MDGSRQVVTCEDVKRRRRKRCSDVSDIFKLHGVTGVNTNSNILRLVSYPRKVVFSPLFLGSLSQDVFHMLHTPQASDILRRA
jgi:hypothetical protein